jgi:hypothetical protein
LTKVHREVAYIEDGVHVSGFAKLLKDWLLR